MTAESEALKLAKYFDWSDESEQVLEIIKLLTTRDLIIARYREALEEIANGQDIAPMTRAREALRGVGE